MGYRGLLEQIKSKIDIVDFLSGYVQLKKSGQNWKGLCPFHAEKTASFMVSPSKQIFHCFGCGAGGDVLAFLLKYENLTYHEAIHLLAEKTGVSIDSRHIDKRSFQKTQKIRNILLEANTFFTQKLRESKSAEAYIGKRGISAESLAAFKLGYAPAGWYSLLKYLRNRGYEDSIIKDSGLAMEGSRGLYDMFRNRILFPITSMSGSVIAFGGRVLDDSLPKYINSPETAVFRKSDSLFGLHEARSHITHEQCALIVEGYLDVIICHQYGLKNVVAPLGTSLTSNHIQKLRTLTNEFVLVFDGDSAGKIAAKRALSVLCRQNHSARILLLPDAEDPDSYIRKHGVIAFRKLIREAKSPVDFLMSISKGEQRVIVREILDLIAQIGDLLLADQMLLELVDRTRIREVVIREELKKIKGKKEGRTESISSHVETALSEETLLLSALIAFPEKADYVLSLLNLDDLKNTAVASLLKKFMASGNAVTFSDILNDADEEEQKMLTHFSVNPGFDFEHVDRIIGDCLRTIERRKLDERILLAERSGDIHLINALLTEKKKFIKGVNL